MANVRPSGDSATYAAGKGMELLKYIAEGASRARIHHAEAPPSRSTNRNPVSSQAIASQGRRAAGATAARRDDDAFSAIHLSWSLTSWALWRRSSASFARQLFTVPSSAGGDNGCTLEIGGGSAATMAAIVEAVVLPSNARLPVTIS